MQKQYKDSSWLFKYYVSKQLSIQKIAAICGVAANTIKTWLKKHNIKSRSISEAAILYISKNGHQSKGKPSKLKGTKRSKEICEKISKKLKGRVFTDEHKNNISKSSKGRIAWNKNLRMVDRLGVSNHEWKGDMASISAKHMYIRRHFKKTGICEHCGKAKLTQWSNKTHTYDRLSRNNWQELCISCHAKYDFKTGLRKQSRSSHINPSNSP